jgi:hypothetical protein
VRLREDPDFARLTAEAGRVEKADDVATVPAVPRDDGEIAGQGASPDGLDRPKSKY